MKAEIVNGYLKVDDDNKWCPFSEEHTSLITSHGKPVESSVVHKASCGIWCALFQRKTWDLNGQVNKDTAYLNCGCGSSYDLLQIPEEENKGG